MYNFHSVIKNFNQKRVLLLGDAMLDIYIYGKASRICREAPVPIVEIKSRVNTGGGAANTAINMSMLGADVLFISVIGDDSEGKILLKKLQESHVDTENIFIDSQRQTITKSRVVANDQLLIRYDTGSTSMIREELEEKIIQQLMKTYSQIDGVLISDYGYGIITEPILFVLEKLQGSIPKPLFVDSKYIEKYKKLYPRFVKPNYQEASQLLGIIKSDNLSRIDHIIAHRDDLFNKTNAQIISVTLDKEGAITFEEDGKIYRTYTNPALQAKAAGAGDTYTTAFSLSLLCNAQLPLASEIAAAAASITIRKEGTAFCTNAELLNFFYSQSKIVTAKEDFLLLLEKLKAKNQKVVFTNGCFDLLHSGHVSYLSQAKKLGDILIVGVNSDKSVKRLKGNERPINSLVDRMQVLAGLSSVDYVIPFSTDTPIQLIKQILPAIYVKGGDYTKEKLPETPVVEKYGGIVRILPFIPEKSTTHIIQKIQVYNGGKHAVA